MKRYLVAASIAAGSIALAMGPVLADNNASNTDTGNGSTNIAVATSSTECKVKQGNLLLIDNEVVVVSNTGNNQANGNTGNGSVDTGNASGDVTVNNSGNSNNATINCAAPPSGNISSNSNTGNGSTNVAVATSSRKLKDKQRNAAGVFNGVARVARTGRNRANNNTGNGSVDTGNASGNVGVTNGPLNTNTSNVGP